MKWPRSPTVDFNTDVCGVRNHVKKLESDLYSTGVPQHAPLFAYLDWCRREGALVAFRCER